MGENVLDSIEEDRFHIKKSDGSFLKFGESMIFAMKSKMSKDFSYSPENSMRNGRVCTPTKRIINYSSTNALGRNFDKEAELLTSKEKRTRSPSPIYQQGAITNTFGNMYTDKEDTKEEILFAASQFHSTI